MKKFIEKMKTKGDAEKRIFAFWSASLITLFIFCIWLLSTVSFYDNNSSTKIKNQANPFSLLIEEFSKPFSSQKNIYPNK
jgi:amino acid permease